MLSPASYHGTRSKALASWTRMSTSLATAQGTSRPSAQQASTLERSHVLLGTWALVVALSENAVQQSPLGCSPSVHSTYQRHRMHMETTFAPDMQAEIVDTKGVAVCSDQTPAPTTPAPTTPAPTTTPVPEPTTTPAPPTTTAAPPPPPPQEDCVCIFDVDRTLTGRQGDVTNCPNNRLESTIWDTAYGGGWLTLSEAAQKLPETFCNSCYLGIVSAGDAGGHDSPERPYLLDNASCQ